MSYCVTATVAKFAGIAVGLVDPIYTAIADTHVESLVNFDMDGGVASKTEYFNLVNSNNFFVNYDGLREFALDRHPVVAITSLTYDPDEDGAEVLVVDDDYFVDSDSGVITISDDYEMVAGVRKLKVIYTWGFATVPQEVQDYASMYAAMLHELNIPKNASGAVLKEVEIGRYRELYDTGNSTIKSKYSILATMRDNIVAKYKIWD